MRNHVHHGLVILAIPSLAIGPPAFGADPTDLARGEAPVLFTSSEGADPGDETVLLDGQLAVGDDIWLWVPELDGGGMVDLGATGSFFRIWDSGNATDTPGDFNDDDRNGLRGMDFDASTGTFLISYEDSTTTGFAFGPIADGDLMRMTPTAVTSGAITGFTLTRLFSECTNGTPGCIGTGDLNALSLADDGSLLFGSGTSQTILTDVPGTLSVGSSTLVRAMLSPDPVNVGPDPYFEATVSGCPLTFCPGIYTGQLRGADVISTGELAFGTSGDYRNTEFSGGGIEIGAIVVCEKADICVVDPTAALPLLDQRTAEVLYSGALFFQTPNVGDAEILDHDVLDDAAEIQALVTVLGASSPAGMALSAHLSASCDGDFDGNGVVGFADLNVVLNAWGPCPGCPADIDGNGVVGFTDLNIVLAAWGPCS